jgi:lipoate-protein ligase A
MRIITHGPEHAFFNMALDEAVSKAVRKNLSPPTLRIYQWDRPSLSIGYFQRISEIDIDYCNKKGYPVVRRLTGGRAILHDTELTYSVSGSSDSSLFRGSLLENYSLISKAMILGLKINGINAKSSTRRKRNAGRKNPACFKTVSYGEITIEGKKVIGSAQKRFSNGFLQHGSILLNFNAGEFCNVLGSNDEEDFKDIGSINDYVPELSFNVLRCSLKEAFEITLKLKMISDNPTKFELNLAKELEQKKYSTREWNYSK